jgi:hypothetical protein
MSAHPYDRARFALLTRHGKEAVLAPPLVERFAAAVDVVGTFDTDTLGTFTREVPRAGTQLQAARRKAMLAIEHSAATLGLGSEGAFLPGPLGFGSWDLEFVVLVDAARGIEIVGRASEPNLHHHGLARTDAELRALVERAGFPEHGVVLRPDGADDPRIRKGLRDWETLAVAFAAALGESTQGCVFVENDLRAHLHPGRMGTIGLAGRDLVRRAAELCPECATPGYGFVAVVPGRPCAACGEPTREPIADEHGCVKCERRDRRARDEGFADPGRCDRCNP